MSADARKLLRLNRAPVARATDGNELLGQRFQREHLEGCKLKCVRPAGFKVDKRLCGVGGPGRFLAAPSGSTATGVLPAPGAAATPRPARPRFGDGALIACANLVRIYKIADLEGVALQGLDLLVEAGEICRTPSRVETERATGIETDEAYAPSMQLAPSPTSLRPNCARSGPSIRPPFPKTPLSLQQQPPTAPRCSTSSSRKCSWPCSRHAPT